MALAWYPQTAAMKVFVSSTYADLREHREAVNKSLARMRVQFSAMEYFGSRADEAVPACTQEIDTCDIVVGIYAWRYGWRPTPESSSITEQEFDYARNNNKCCLCYIIEENYPWPPPLIDIDENAERLRAFKRKVSLLVRSTFTTPDNLSTQVAADLVRELATIEPFTISQPQSTLNPWQGYCGTLIEELNSDLTIRATYIPLDATDQAGNPFDLEEEVERWIKRKEEPMLAILGDYGSGKTTFCRHLADRLAQRYVENRGNAELPVLISLRQHRTTATIAEMVNATLLQFGRTAQELSTEPRQRPIILLDGMDEQAERFTESEAKRQFFQIHAALPKSARVILTSRTHFFRSQMEEADVLTLHDPSNTGLLPARPRPLTTLYIASLSAEKQDRYLQLSQGVRWQNVRGTIDSIYDLRDLSRRPILLNLVSRLLDDFQHYQGRVGQVEVYKIAVESWIRREQWRGLHQDEIERFLEGLAFSLLQKYKESLSIADLRQEVASRFRSRILSHLDIDEWDGKVRTSLFLSRDANGAYFFIHRSFQEYFLARKILRALRERSFDELNSVYAVSWSSETKQFFHGMMPDDALEDLYFMLGCHKLEEVTWLASDLLLDRKLPIPFSKDSPHIPRLAKTVLQKAGAGIRACLWVYEQLKIGEAIPTLIASLDAHSGESAQRMVLSTIVNIGDSRAIPELERLRKELEVELDNFRRSYGPNYERVVQDRLRHHDNDPDSERIRNKWRQGRLATLSLDSIVLSQVGYPKDYRMWGYTLEEIDQAIAAIREN